MNGVAKHSGRFQCAIYLNKDTTTKLVFSNDSLLLVLPLINQNNNFFESSKNVKNNQIFQVNEQPLEIWINLRRNEQKLLDCLFEMCPIARWFKSLNKSDNTELELNKGSIIKNKIILSNETAFLFDVKSFPTYSEIECEAESVDGSIIQKKKFIISVKGFIFYI